MTLRKRTPFTIGPEWEPVSDPHEAEALARAQFQAQVNANEQARADAKKSQQFQAMQRLFEQQEDREFRAEDQALAEQSWNRKLQYEIEPRNEREGFQLAADITYKQQSLEYDRQRNAAVAAQGLASRRERARKAQAAEKQKLADTDFAMREGELEAKAKKEELDRGLERDRWDTKQDVEQAILKQELKQLKASLTSGAKDQKAQDAELGSLFSLSGLGAETPDEYTTLERVQSKLNRAEVPSTEEIDSLLNIYSISKGKTQETIMRSLQSSFGNFQRGQERQLQEKIAKVLKDQGLKLSAGTRRGSVGADFGRASEYWGPEWMGGADPERQEEMAFPSPESKKAFITLKTEEFRNELKAKLNNVTHLLSRFRGVIPTPSLGAGQPSRPDWSPSGSWGSP